MSRRRLLGIVSLLLVNGSVCSLAHAETAQDLEVAKGLFEDGRRLMAEGRYDAACNKFESSMARARGIGTKFNLADCEEHRGNFGRAQALFLDVAEQAREAGQSDREALARGRADAIDEKLAHLEIDQEVPGGEIHLDGRTVSAAEAQELLAIPTGRHRITVSAPDKKPWTKEIDVPKPGTFVILTVPRLEPAAAAEAHRRAPKAPVLAPAPVTDAPLVDSDPNLGDGARRTALILGGVGVGAAVAGVAFGLQFLSDNHDAQHVCPTSYGCSDTEIAQHTRYISDAHAARTRAFLSAGVGAAAFAGAAILYFTAPRHGALRATTGLGPNGAWNVAVHGDF